MQYSDSLSPDVTITASDTDSLGKNLSAAAVGLPAGMSLSITSTTDDSTLPGIRTWKVAGVTTAAPDSYPVTDTVTDETGYTGSTSFTIVVTREDAFTTAGIAGGLDRNFIHRNFLKTKNPPFLVGWIK